MLIIYLLQSDSNRHVVNDISLSNAAPEAIWHARMGHVSPRRGRVKTLMRGLASSMKVKVNKTYFCESCHFGKAMRKHFNSISDFPQAIDVLGRICVDLYGPTRIQSVDNEQYILVILDQFSRYVEAHCLRTKSEALFRYRSSTIVSEPFMVKI